MTRDEAIACFQKHIPDVCYPDRVIDFYVEVGMLKVEKEKTTREKAVEVLVEFGVQGPAEIINKLHNAGFEIVEK